MIDGNHAIERSNDAREFTPTGSQPTEERGKHVVVYRRDWDSA